MEPILLDWLSFGIRWLHVVTAIAWIGSSFYFIALDLGLRKPDGLPEGVAGEEWQVHGGGFYHLRKYTLAPERLPERLVWFKWESYATWLSGFALLAVVYYVGAELFLIDRHVLDVEPWVAILISLGGLASGWIVYDLLCRSPLGKRDRLLFVCVFAYLIALTWLFTQLFSDRGAFIHSGAAIATIMTANVFFIIIPNQKKAVATLRAGGRPDPALGRQAKQRSTHNNYLTLPVVFLMLSSHYPLAFASKWNWAIVALILAAGAIVRLFFNRMHSGMGKPWWTWGAAAACFAAIVWLSTFPPEERGALEEAAANPAANPQVERMLASQEFDAVRDVVLGRCSMCHAREPVWEGIPVAPGGAVLETDADILKHADRIHLQAVRTHAMPPGNITEAEPEDRALLARWYARYADIR